LLESLGELSLSRQSCQIILFFKSAKSAVSARCVFGRFSPLRVGFFCQEKPKKQQRVRTKLISVNGDFQKARILPDMPHQNKPIYYGISNKISNRNSNGISNRNSNKNSNRISEILQKKCHLVTLHSVLTNQCFVYIDTTEERGDTHSHSRQPRKSCYMLPVDVATK
jgi:hypothetical protein